MNTPARLLVADAFATPSDDLKFILGQPCFAFIDHARLWRATGADIPRKAESEQAFFIGRMLFHYFNSRERWQSAWGDELQYRIDASNPSKEK
jgi:hypothetical protein